MQWRDTARRRFARDVRLDERSRPVEDLAAWLRWLDVLVEDRASARLGYRDGSMPPAQAEIKLPGSSRSTGHISTRSAGEADDPVWRSHLPSRNSRAARSLPPSGFRFACNATDNNDPDADRVHRWRQAYLLWGMSGISPFRTVTTTESSPEITLSAHAGPRRLAVAAGKGRSVARVVRERVR